MIKPNPVIDNTALAQRHTPRLNRFLAAVRDATHAAHGTWHRVDPKAKDKAVGPWDVRRYYAKQFDEAGVLLTPDTPRKRKRK